MTFDDALTANTLALAPYNATMDAGLTPVPQVVENVLNTALDMLACPPPDPLVTATIHALLETTELVARRVYKYQVVIEDYRYSVTD